MPDDRPTSETIPLAIWLEELGGILGPSGGLGPTDDLCPRRSVAQRCARFSYN